MLFFQACPSRLANFPSRSLVCFGYTEAFGRWHFCGFCRSVGVRKMSNGTLLCGCRIFCDSFSGSGREEGKHGSIPSSSSNKSGSAAAAAAAFALSSSSVVPSATGGGDADGDEESYEDDEEWEDEPDPEVAAEEVSRRRTGRRERGGEEQRERGGENLGPFFSLELSFRESFASVNDVLSVIASGSGTSEGNTAASSTSLKTFRGSGGAGGGGSNRRRDPDSSSSLRDEDEQHVSPGGSAVSPLPPPFRRAQSRRTAGGDDGVSELVAGGSIEVFPSTTPGEGIGTAAGAGSAATGVAGGFGVGFGGEEMPAEMSGMLQRYSEMMVKVVQVGITASTVRRLYCFV